jgi:fatty-acid peroxygenase
MSAATSKHPSAPSFGLANPMSLLNRGYEFWETERQRSGSELVQKRLLHERITAIRGPEAAQFFYEEPCTERGSALPTPLVGPLFGKGPVHMLDGADHRHRKSMFNGLLDADAAVQVTAGLAQRWDERVSGWRWIDVFDQVGQLLLESGAEWLGIQLSPHEVPGRTRDLLAMVDGFGAPSGRQLKARRARRRTDAWAAQLIESARGSAVEGRKPLDVVAHHRTESGELLGVHTAAVELINLLRPLVAVTWLVSGMFQAYDVNPDRRAEVLDERVSATDVAQEVRRQTPFVPFLATRATEDMSWQDAVIPRGTLIVLDVWGTNHDPRIWHDPAVFDPGRFKQTPVTPYNLVPQGGGFRETGHRCPGEDLTLAVLMTLVHRVAELSYKVVGPRADLRRMPPKPHLKMRIGR